jgi:hypothetical protein
LQLSSELRGEYTLLVGLYDPTTGERVGPVRAVDGSDQPNRGLAIGTLALQ